MGGVCGDLSGFARDGDAAFQTASIWLVSVNLIWRTEGAQNEPDAVIVLLFRTGTFQSNERFNRMSVRRRTVGDGGVGAPSLTPAAANGAFTAPMWERTPMKRLE